MKTSARHDDWLMTKLADADFAAEYLNAASEDEATGLKFAVSAH